MIIQPRLLFQRNDALSAQRQAATAGPISASTVTVAATSSSLSRVEAMRGRTSRANSKEDEAPFVVERTGDYMEAKTLPKVSKYDQSWK